MNNSSYIWKDFTKEDLKAWILANTDIKDWNHCHNIELDEQQLKSLCSAIGCVSISPENIWIYFSDTVSPQQWWIGTEDDSAITLTFPDTCKKVKGESFNNNLKRAKTRGVEDNSEEGNILILRNIRSVSSASDARGSYCQTPNEYTFLSYIGFTDNNISATSTTNGSKLYTKSYLTTLGNYGINGKQFKIITYLDNPPVYNDNEGYHFYYKQNYGNNADTNNSKKYRDWAINNTSMDIVWHNFTSGGGSTSSPTVTNVTEQGFDLIIGGSTTHYIKNAWQDVYVLCREAPSSYNGWWSDNGNQPHIASENESYAEMLYRTYGTYMGIFHVGQLTDNWTMPLIVMTPGKGGDNPNVDADYIIDWYYPTMSYKKNSDNTWYNINDNIWLRNKTVDWKSETQWINCPHQNQTVGIAHYSWGFAARKKNTNRKPVEYDTHILGPDSDYAYNRGRWYAVEFDTSGRTYCIQLNVGYWSIKGISESIASSKSTTLNFSSLTAYHMSYWNNTWHMGPYSSLQAIVTADKLFPGIFKNKTVINEEFYKKGAFDCDTGYDNETLVTLGIRSDESEYGKCLLKFEGNNNNGYAVILIDNRS